MTLPLNPLPPQFGLILGPLPIFLLNVSHTLPHVIEGAVQARIVGPVFLCDILPKSVNRCWMPDKNLYPM